jgi:hypothetical protein
MEPKLTIFKIWVFNCKNEKILGVISEVFFFFKFKNIVKRLIKLQFDL